MRGLQSLSLISLELLGTLADQLPVQMILCLGEHHALGGNDLRRTGFALTDRGLHRLDQCLSNGAHNHTTRRVLARVNPECVHEVLDYFDVSCGFLLVFFSPSLFKICVSDAGEPFFKNQKKRKEKSPAKKPQDTSK